MGNGALDHNPPNSDIHISVHGSDWLWAAFSVFAVSLLVTVFLDLTRKRGTRLFHQIAIIILTGTTLSYFCMASDLGAAGIEVEFRGDGGNPTRQIWYVHHIQWFLSFPLLVLSLLLTTGLSLSDIFTAIFMMIVVVVCGLVGAVVHSTYKWGFFTIGMCAQFYVWYALLWHGYRTTFAANGAFRSHYLVAASYLSFMFITYPICWALSEGSNIITPTSEMIWYGILDIFTGPVFLFCFLWQLHSVDYEAFAFDSGKYTDTHVVHGETTKAAEAGVV